MKEIEIHLLRNYQHLMLPHEKMMARWLTEEWDGLDETIPTWLRNRTYREFNRRDYGKPNAIARSICLRLLENHKHEISLKMEE